MSWSSLFWVFGGVSAGKCSIHVLVRVCVCGMYVSVFVVLITHSLDSDTVNITLLLGMLTYAYGGRITIQDDPSPTAETDSNKKTD